MTYTTYEASRHEAQPVELYRFTVGGGIRRVEGTGGDTLVASDGWEYGTQAAAEAAGWTFTDDLNLPSNASHWVVGDTEQVYAGARSLKAVMTGDGSLVLSTLQLRATRTFDTGDGLTANTAYLVKVRGYMNIHSSFDGQKRLVVAGATTAGDHITEAGEDAWEELIVPMVSTSSGELTVSLVCAHSFVTGNRTIWWDQVEIWLAEDQDATEDVVETTAIHYTSADVAVTFDGDTYAPAIFTRTSFASGESEGGDIEVTMPRDHAIALLCRDGLPLHPVTLEIFRLHRQDVAAAAGEDPSTALYAVAFKGKVARARYTGPSCILTVSSGQAWLSRKLPRILVQPQCNWMLYGIGCGLVKENFLFQSTISTIAGSTVTIAGLATESGADVDKFQNGFLVVPSGERAFIESQDGDVVTLLNPPLNLAVNDAVNVYQGCDRTPQTCHTRFANLARFGGDALLPKKSPWGPAGFEVAD